MPEEQDVAVETPAQIEEAPEPILAELLADLVRDRCKTAEKLTPLGALEANGRVLEPEEQEELIAQLLADEGAKDLRVMRTSNGAAFLYSSDHMSDGYARILLRVEENNPYETIASTVREESEEYPRPTPIAALRDSVFGLDPERIAQMVDEMSRLPSYSDIQRITASTGALYLFSNRFLDRDWAESLVEWEEVGRYKSP